MAAKDCRRYESCNAPLCPMDEKSLKSAIWYPDDEICRLNEFCNEIWIDRQKRIAKKRNKNTYYTHSMLQHNCIIGKAISGIDPDCPLEDIEKATESWKKKHPEINISDKRRKESSERMKRLQQEKKRAIRIEN